MPQGGSCRWSKAVDAVSQPLNGFHGTVVGGQELVDFVDAILDAHKVTVVSLKLFLRLCLVQTRLQVMAACGRGFPTRCDPDMPARNGPKFADGSFHAFRCMV